VPEQLHAACRGRECQHRTAPTEPADVVAMNTIDILSRADGLKNLVFVDMLGQRHQNALYLCILIERLDHLPAGTRPWHPPAGGTPVSESLPQQHAARSTQHLAPHIHLTGWSLAHQHLGQCRLAALCHQQLHLLDEMLEQLRSNTLAVD
jgi:hypothetical protein